MQDIFENLATINAPEGQDDDDVYLRTVQTLNTYFRVQGNAAYERHVLRQLWQELGDFHSFMLRLRKQGRSVVGEVSSLELRTKLLEEPYIELAAAIGTFRSDYEYDFKYEISQCSP